MVASTAFQRIGNGDIASDMRALVWGEPKLTSIISNMYGQSSQSTSLQKIYMYYSLQQQKVKSMKHTCTSLLSLK